MVTKAPSRLLALTALAALAVGCGAQKQHKKIQQQGEALRFELAALYVDKGVPRAAVPLLQKVLAEDPEDARARVLYGKVLRDLGLYPAATKELSYALKLEPKNAEAHSALGILYDVQRKPSLARRHHLVAVKLAPGMAKYRNNLGFSLFLAGKTESAIAQLERALAMDPSLAVAYNNLGFAYGRLGQFDRAERTFRTALSEASTLLNMSMVYQDHGKLAEARDLRARAYAIDPDLRDERDL